MADGTSSKYGDVTLDQGQIDLYKSYLQQGMSSAEIASAVNSSTENEITDMTAEDVNDIISFNKLQLPSGQITGTDPLPNTDSEIIQNNPTFSTTGLSGEERMASIQAGMDAIAAGDTSAVPGANLTAVQNDSSITSNASDIQQIAAAPTATASTVDGVTGGQAEAGSATASSSTAGTAESADATAGTSDAGTATASSSQAGTAQASTGTASQATASSGEASQGTAATTGAEAVDNVALAGAPKEVVASTYEAALAGNADSIQAVEGTVSQDAIAALDTAQFQAGQAGVVTVNPNDIQGGTVEAATATMSPEDLAEAATVAGMEVAKIERFREQLANVGFTPEQITAFGQDPAAMERELLNYTQEQRGLIAGIPEEAFVSVQMEQLLNGLAEGEIPAWAKPAVASVEGMLARRGLSASTVGRDALANVIIQASIPLAQSNAQTVKEAAFRQQDFERNVAIREAEFRQQAVLQNAQNTFGLKLTNLSNEQQARIANSQFLQTVAITNANNAQQAAIQNAVNLTNMDMAKMSTAERLAVRNADAFLQMDMTNLNNKQQAAIINGQMQQQTLLSNQAAVNAARQFNAASQNQVNMFMSDLASRIEQFNASQTNAMSQFNVAEKNRASLQNAQLITQTSLTNAQLKTQVSMQNAEIASRISEVNAQLGTNVSMRNAELQTQTSQTNAQLSTQSSIANAELASRASEVNAQLATQSSISNAQLATQTSIANADNKVQTSIANAQMATQTSIANAELDTQTSIQNARLSTDVSIANSNVDAQIAIADAEMANSVAILNAQLEADVLQWNAANAQLVEQSNIEWRRQANLADTAAQNAINQQTVQNAFGMTLNAQNILWQQLRDEASFTFQAFENDQNRKAQLYAVAIGNDPNAAQQPDQQENIIAFADKFFGGI